MNVGNKLVWLGALCAMASLTACGGNDDPPPLAGDTPPVETFTYDATVRRTALGIPHIKANDFGSLGYGLGYAQAEDNLCVLMDDIVTDRGERARYFGADGTYSIPANGAVAGNVNSDFFWKLMLTPELIANLKAKSLPAAVAATAGFRQGFNRYVREIKAGGHAGRHAACRAADWLFELDGDDLYRRYLRLALIASSSALINEIATAQPPSGSEGEEADATPSVETLAAGFRDSALARAFSRERPFGSNMYAIGSAASTSGVPMVFGNPHFPWTGTERLYIFHATVPGQLDIMGAALYGVPAVLIGFTDYFAWSHTVSTAWRFTFYELTLSPESPTSYVYEGDTLEMTAVPLTIQVRQEDGALVEQTRTLYRSKFGPMLTIAATDGVELMPWNQTRAYTLRDVNYENDRLINQFFHWNTAKSLDEFISLHKSVLGIPWVNTIASGPGGKAYYGDVSVVPNVPNEKVATCANTPVHAALQQAGFPGLPVLDGSMSACEWDTDEDAPVPGIFGPANLPTLQRDDWVHNCNDSYWLSNPAEPLTGYAGIIGLYDGHNPAGEESERSMRTRLCMQQVLRHLDQDGDDGLGVTFDANADKKFDLDELQETVLSSQIYTAQLARDDIVSMTCAFGTVLTEGGPVDVADACGVLGDWSMQSNLTDVGSHIWREFFNNAAPNPAGVGPNPTLWNTPFSPEDPVNTPRDINYASPLVQDALGSAVAEIGNKGHALDAPLGTLQYSGVIGEKFIPIFGGTGTEGAFTIVSTGDLRAKTENDPLGGYRVTYGNSYIQTVTWEPDGTGFKPRAEGFITYSQSTDPASPHFFDFTEEYSAKRWHRFPFEEADVIAQTQSILILRE
jgi:acyl-homoserine-lactone acylase